MASKKEHQTPRAAGKDEQGRPFWPLTDKELQDRQKTNDEFAERNERERASLVSAKARLAEVKALIADTDLGRELKELKEEIDYTESSINSRSELIEKYVIEIKTRRTFDAQSTIPGVDTSPSKTKAKKESAEERTVPLPLDPSAPGDPSKALATIGPRRGVIVDAEVVEEMAPTTADKVKDLLRKHGPMNVRSLCDHLKYNENDASNWAEIQDALRRCGAINNRGIWHLPDQLHVLSERAGEVPVEEPAEAAPAAPAPPALPALPPAPPVAMRELLGALKGKLSCSEAELAHALGTTLDAVKAGLQPLTDAKCIEIVPGVEESYYRLPTLRDMVLGLVRRTPGIRIEELLEQISVWKASEIEGKIDALLHQGAIVVRGKQHYLPEHAPPEGPKGGKKGKAKPAKGKDTKAPGKPSPKARPASAPTTVVSGVTADAESLIIEGLVLDALRGGGELDTMAICRRASLRHSTVEPALGRLLEAKRVSRALSDGRYYWLLSEPTEAPAKAPARPAHAPTPAAQAPVELTDNETLILKVLREASPRGLTAQEVQRATGLPSYQVHLDGKGGMVRRGLLFALKGRYFAEKPGAGVGLTSPAASASSTPTITEAYELKLRGELRHFLVDQAQLKRAIRSAEVLWLGDVLPEFEPRSHALFVEVFQELASSGAIVVKGDFIELPEATATPLASASELLSQVEEQAAAAASEPPATEEPPAEAPSAAPPAPTDPTDWGWVCRVLMGTESSIGTIATAVGGIALGLTKQLDRFTVADIEPAGKKSPTQAELDAVLRLLEPAGALCLVEEEPPTYALGANINELFIGDGLWTRLKDYLVELVHDHETPEPPTRQILADALEVPLGLVAYLVDELLKDVRIKQQGQGADAVLLPRSAKNTSTAPRGAQAAE